MPVTTDKLLLFRSHECSKGLSDDVQREISDAAELVQYDSGDFVHRSNQPMTSVFFVVHGRLRQSVVDMHGNVLSQRFLTRGSQFGALGAAQADPVPVEVVAVEPSAALKLDFETTLRFTRTHEIFGLNLTQSIAGMVRDVLLSDKQPKKPTLVTVFHESDASRPLTQRLIRRFLELGETPNLMSDQLVREPIASVSFKTLVKDGNFLSREDIRRQINLWSDSGRVILDVDAALDPGMRPCWSNSATK